MQELHVEFLAVGPSGELGLAWVSRCELGVRLELGDFHDLMQKSEMDIVPPSSQRVVQQVAQVGPAGGGVWLTGKGVPRPQAK